MPALPNNSKFNRPQAVTLEHDGKPFRVSRIRGEWKDGSGLIVTETAGGGAEYDHIQRFRDMNAAFALCLQYARERNALRTEG